MLPWSPVDCCPLLELCFKLPPCVWFKVSSVTHLYCRCHSRVFHAHSAAMFMFISTCRSRAIDADFMLSRRWLDVSLISRDALRVTLTSLLPYPTHQKDSVQRGLSGPVKATHLVMVSSSPHLLLVFFLFVGVLGALYSLVTGLWLFPPGPQLVSLAVSSY